MFNSFMTQIHFIYLNIILLVKVLGLRCHVFKYLLHCSQVKKKALIQFEEQLYL